MGSIAKGISSAVSNIGKSIGGPIGGLLKGVGDFAQSPLGQLAITAGLAFFTGGSSLMAGGGLSSMLGGGGLSSLLSSGGLSSALSGVFGGGGASNLIGSLASNFLGDAASGVSQGGLSSLLSLTQGQDSGGLMQILGSLFNAQGQQAQDPNAQAGQQLNLQQIMAFRQAQSLME